MLQIPCEEPFKHPKPLLEHQGPGTVRSSKAEDFFKLKHATVQQKAPENNNPRLFLSHQGKNCPNLFRTKIATSTDRETRDEAITIIQSDIIQQVI